MKFEFHYHVLEGWKVQSRAAPCSSHLLVHSDRLWEIFPSAYSQRPVSSRPARSATFSPADELRRVFFDLPGSISRRILKVKYSLRTQFNRSADVKASRPLKMFVLCWFPPLCVLLIDVLTRFLSQYFICVMIWHECYSGPLLWRVGTLAVWSGET